MRLTSGSSAPSLLHPTSASSRHLSGLTMALALTVPGIEGVFPKTVSASEPELVPIVQTEPFSTTIEFDDKQRPVREICREGGWSDTLDPSTGKKLFRDLTTPEGTHRLAYDDYGHLCPPLHITQASDARVAEATYIADVARRFCSPESLQRFFECYFNYTWDTPNPRHPLMVGSKTNYDDYWQTPSETLRRCEQGKYLGDCDDLAFLAQAILQQQGKQALVLNVGAHAICVWVDSSPQGFTAHSLCTFGYDRNGSLAQGDLAPTHSPTLKDALQSLMKKYEKGGLGSDSGFSYAVGDTIDVMLPDLAKRTQCTLPLEALTDVKLYGYLRPYELNRDETTTLFLREAIERYPTATIFRLELVNALKREQSSVATEELERELINLCALQPLTAAHQEALSLFYSERREFTKAIHHCLKALQLDIKGSSRLMPYLTSLSSFIGEYTKEFGTQVLREALPSMRSALHTTGYPKEQLALMRTCFFHLGEQEQILPLLAERAEATLRSSHSIAAAFSPRSRERVEDTTALIELLREQLRFGMIADATSTFNRVLQHRGPGPHMREAVPSLRHLPYREDTVQLYRAMLGQCVNWSGGHMELVEYLHAAGQNQAAILELRTAVSCCTDIPAIVRDLESMPGLAQTPEWASIMEQLRERRSTNSTRRH